MCKAALVFGLLATPAVAQQPETAGNTASAGGTTTPAGGYAQRFATVCAACHGANGRSDMAATPVLAGQPSLYVITQLFLFREGRRGTEAMIAVAKTMNDDDLRGFSEFIGTLPPVPAPRLAEVPDASRMSRGQALSREHKCVFCHGEDFSGGEQVPRIGGQPEDYLQASLQGFRTGKRPGYTQAMGSAVSHIPPEDLNTLAYYLARFPGMALGATGK